MYFAIETFAGHPDLMQTCRLEGNVLVTKDGPEIFTLMEHMEEALDGYSPPAPSKPGDIGIAILYI